MHLIDTKVAHENTGWRIDFVGDDGDAVTVHVANAAYLDEETAVEHARAILVQLTAYGTRSHSSARTSFSFRSSSTMIGLNRRDETSTVANQPRAS